MLILTVVSEAERAAAEAASLNRLSALVLILTGDLAVCEASDRDAESQSPFGFGADSHTRAERKTKRKLRYGLNRLSALVLILTVWSF